MKIIDIHTHTDYGTPYDCPETELHKRNFDFLMEEYKNVGIVAGGFSYYSQEKALLLGIFTLTIS